MTLKLIIEKPEDVEEPMRGLYVEKDGKLRLDVEGIEDPAPIRAQVTKLNRENAERRKTVEAWEKAVGGKTPQEIEDLITEHAEIKEKLEAGHDRKTIEQIRKDAVEAASKETAKALKRLEEANANTAAERDLIRRQYEESQINAAIMSAISEHKGSPQYLVNNIKPLVRAKYEDGRLRLIVTKEDGDEKLNGKGELQTISELVAEMAQQETWARAFEGTGASGSGSRQPTGNTQPRNPMGVRSKKDLAGDKEKSFPQKFDEFVRSFPSQELGIAAYDKLPD